MKATRRSWKGILYTTASLLIGASLSAQEPASAERQAEGAQLDLRSGEQWGQYLVDGEGMALYMFTADQKEQSNCHDVCAEKWPPLVTDGDPAVAADALESSLLSTIERRDGKTQVTYGGWPLYYYYEDEQPGDTKGQDVHDSGGEWYLLGPDGNKVEEPATESGGGRDSGAKKD